MSTIQAILNTSSEEYKLLRAAASSEFSIAREAIIKLGASPTDTKTIEDFHKRAIYLISEHDNGHLFIGTDKWERTFFIGKPGLGLVAKLGKFRINQDHFARFLSNILGFPDQCPPAIRGRLDIKQNADYYTFRENSATIGDAEKPSSDAMINRAYAEAALEADRIKDDDYDSMNGKNEVGLDDEGDSESALSRLSDNPEYDPEIDGQDQDSDAEVVERFQEATCISGVFKIYNNLNGNFPFSFVPYLDIKEIGAAIKNNLIPELQAACFFVYTSLGGYEDVKPVDALVHQDNEKGYLLSLGDPERRAVVPKFRRALLNNSFYKAADVCGYGSYTG